MNVSEHVLNLDEALNKAASGMSTAEDAQFLRREIVSLLRALAHSFEGVPGRGGYLCDHADYLESRV